MIANIPSLYPAVIKQMSEEYMWAQKLMLFTSVSLYNTHSTILSNGLCRLSHGITSLAVLFEIMPEVGLITVI